MDTKMEFSCLAHKERLNKRVIKTITWERKTSQFNYSKITSVHVILVSSLLNLHQHLATRHLRQVFVQSDWLQKSKWMILHYMFLTKFHMTNSIRKICPIIAGNLPFCLSPSTGIYYGQKKNCQYSNV